MRNEDYLFLTEEDYAVAAENGIPSKFADLRFYEWGYSREKAIHPDGWVKPKAEKGPKLANDGKPMEERHKWIAIAHKNKITTGAFYARIRKGMTDEEAATTPYNDKYRQKTKTG
jgi:hypothetical protein